MANPDGNDSSLTVQYKTNKIRYMEWLSTSDIDDAINKTAEAECVPFYELDVIDVIDECGESVL